MNYRDDNSHAWEGHPTVELTCRKCGERFEAEPDDAKAPSAWCEDCKERDFYNRQYRRAVQREFAKVS